GASSWGGPVGTHRPSGRSAAGSTEARWPRDGGPMAATLDRPPPAAEAGTNHTAGARRIAAAFAAARSAGRAALVPYVVAGYPDAETSARIALTAIDAGAALLAVGLPAYDPLADGATLQRASQIALAAGATLDGSLRLIDRVARSRRSTPIVPM